jgi:hypothetical protein
MKLSLTKQQTDAVVKAINALRRELDHEQIPIARFTLSEETVLVRDHHGNQIGFLNISGVSAGNGWTSRKQECSQSIRVDLAA